MSKVVNKSYKDEAVQGYNLRTAREEADRCLLCHDAPCSKSCPAGTDPAGFIQSLKFNNVKGAAETIRLNNPLGGTCARVCPYDKLCQDACSRCGIDEPIEIGRLQRFIVEQEEAFGMETMEVPATKKNGKVACIGAGPASLTVATKLAEAGYDVTVFEKEDKPGGVLTYGIVPARLPQHTVDHDINLIKKLGVKIKTGTKVGSPKEVLSQGYDAVFVGIGLSASSKIDIPGSDAKGAWTAMDYLKEARENNGNFDHGNKVIVIGGGDVALDCAATAKLAGAEKVMIYYRRTIEEAPANIEELSFVQSLGITITTEFAPTEIITAKDRVDKVVFKGRDNESQATVKADTIVFAIGQTPDASFDEGWLNEDGIFSAGDIVNGGKTVVDAVSEGKEVAEKIVNYLEGKEGAK